VGGQRITGRPEGKRHASGDAVQGARIDDASNRQAEHRLLQLQRLAGNAAVSSSISVQRVGWQQGVVGGGAGGPPAGGHRQLPQAPAGGMPALPAVPGQPQAPAPAPAPAPQAPAPAPAPEYVEKHSSIEGSAIAEDASFVVNDKSPSGAVLFGEIVLKQGTSFHFAG